LYHSSFIHALARRTRANYETWLGQLVAALHTHLDARDRTFARFLLDLPYVPPDVLALLRELCVEPER
jgi:symplekin